jgi:hypothetical protein
MAGGFDGYVKAINRMFPEFKHPLDSFRDYLLPCKSISQAKEVLLALQRNSSE